MRPPLKDILHQLSTFPCWVGFSNGDFRVSGHKPAEPCVMIQSDERKVVKKALDQLEKKLNEIKSTRVDMEDEDVAADYGGES